MDTNTITVTFNDFTCDLQWNGSEVDILQKTDYEHDSGSHSLYFFYDGPFAPQPVQAIGTMATHYVVTNEGDCYGVGVLARRQRGYLHGDAGGTEHHPASRASIPR